MRDQLLAPDRMRGIQEELAAFFLDHVIHKAREYRVEIDIDLMLGIVRDLILYICS